MLLDKWFVDAPIGLTLRQLDGTIIAVNSAFAETVGRQPSDLQGFSYAELCPRKYRVLDRRVLDVLSSVRQYGPYEKEYYFHDGQESRRDSAVVPAMVESKLVEHEGEDIIYSAVRRLSEFAGDLLQSLLQELPMAVCVSDMEGNLVFANQAYADIIGRTVAETLRISYWNITPKRYERDEKELLEQVNATGTFGPYYKHYIHKDESRAWIPVRLDLRKHILRGTEYLSAVVESPDEEIDGGEILSLDEPPIKPIE